MEAAENAWRRIGELFVEKALISGSELEQALAVQAASGQPLGEVLVSQGLISSPEMTEALMEQLGRKVAKEEGFGSALWSDVQRRTSRRPEQQLPAPAESADELNERISQLTRHLTETKAELGAAEKRIGELTVIVDQLQADRHERSHADAKWRRSLKAAIMPRRLPFARAATSGSPPAC